MNEGKINKSDILFTLPKEVRKAEVIEYGENSGRLRVENPILFTLNSPHIMELLTIKEENSNIDKITSEVTFKNNNTELLVKNLSQEVGFKLSSTVFYLLLAIIVEFNNSTRSQKQISLSVEKYQQLRGLNNKKKLLEQIKEDLNSLSSFYISYDKKNIKKSKGCISFYNVRLIQEWGCTNDNITICFSDKYYEHLKNAYPMPFHKEIFKLNPKTSAPSISIYLCFLYNMNHDKKNKNIVSVRSILKKSRTIPSKDKAYPKLNQKIIEPFERALDALPKRGILRWHYVNAKNEPLTQEQLNTFSYNIFINSYVYYEFITDIPVYKRKKRRTKNFSTKNQAKSD